MSNNSHKFKSFHKNVKKKNRFWLQPVNLSTSKINYVQSRNVMKSLWMNGLVGRSASGIGKGRKLRLVPFRLFREGFCFGCIAIVFIVGKTAIIPPHLSSCFKWFSLLQQSCRAQQFRVVCRFIVVISQFSM